MTTAECHLVTGGSGYFGCVVVQALRERGHRVRVFDLRDVDDRASDVEFFEGDIRNREAIGRACDGVNVVHHNVAQVPLAKDPDAFWTVNVDGTRNLLEAATVSGVRKVLCMSSSAIYGVPESNPVDSLTQPNPQEAYGKAKFSGEQLTAEYVKKGLDVTVIRPRTIMGHGRLGIMQLLFEWIYLGRNIPVLGRGDNLYQFVHAQDLVSACLLAAEQPGPSTYNIGAAEFCTMRETLQALIEHAGTRSKVISVPMAPAVQAMKLTSKLGLSPLGAYHWLMYGRSMYFDLSRPQQELGWRPKYGNVAMFCETYDWYVAHREDILSRKNASHHRSAVKPGFLEYVSRALSVF